MDISKLVNTFLIKRRSILPGKPERKEEHPEKERWLTRKLFHRIGLFRPATSHGMLNMPRYQPCPKCRGDSKRDRKTPRGAWYRCTRCKDNFFEGRK